MGKSATTDLSEIFRCSLPGIVIRFIRKFLEGGFDCMVEFGTTTQLTVLEHIRRQRGLTKTVLAQMAQTNTPAITNLERYNRRSWPALRRRLAQTLGVPEKLLFEDNGWPRAVTKVVTQIAESSNEN